MKFLGFAIKIVVLYYFVSLSLCQQNDLTFTVADYLKSKCRVGPGINSPSDLTGSPTLINVILVPLRFMGFSDVDETFSLVMSISLTWEEVCSKKAMQEDSFKFKNFTTFPLYDGVLWTPMLQHINSKNDRPLHGSDFERGIEVRAGGIFNAYWFGYFENYCDLKLRNFPFDT